MMRSRTQTHCVFAALLATVLVASTAGAAKADFPGPGGFIIHSSTRDATAVDSFTKIFFAPAQPFSVNLPQIREDGLGKFMLMPRVVSTTRARLSLSENLRVRDPGFAGPGLTSGEPVRVPTTREQTGSPQIEIVTRPALRLNFGYEPDDADAFECDMEYVGPPDKLFEVYEPTAGAGDGDATCVWIEITADDLKHVGLPELPEEFMLIKQFLDPPYAGDKALSNADNDLDADGEPDGPDAQPALVELPVCKMVGELGGKFVPGLRTILGDRCAIKVRGTVHAMLMTPPGPGFGYHGIGQLCRPGTLQGNQVDCLALVGDPQALRWSEATQAFFFPPVCLPEDSQLSVGFRDLGYRAHITRVTLGFKVVFNVRLNGDQPGEDLFTIFETPPDVGVQLLEQDKPLDLSVRDPDPSDRNPAVVLGTVKADQQIPTVELTGPANVNEGSSAAYTVVSNRTDGRVDNCTAPQNMRYQFRADPKQFPIVKTGDPTHSFTFANQGSRRILADAVDEADNASNLTRDVSVHNVPPAVKIKELPLEPLPIGSKATYSATAIDPGPADPITFDWNFGDGQFAQATTQGRTDSRHVTHNSACLCSVRVTVTDDVVTGDTATGDVVVFDPSKSITGRAEFRVDDAAIGAEPGSTYIVDGNVRYLPGEMRPDGHLDVEFTPARAERPSTLKTSGFHWLVGLERGLIRITHVQGDALVDGTAGWRYRLRMTESTSGTEVTVTLWRPGVTTLDEPDYRFGANADRGEIGSHGHRGFPAHLNDNNGKPGIG